MPFIKRLSYGWESWYAFSPRSLVKCCLYCVFLASQRETQSLLGSIMTSDRPELHPAVRHLVNPGSQCEKYTQGLLGTDFRSSIKH